MAEANLMKRTPLHDFHVRNGAKMVPFGGFEMPVQYGGIVEEHMAVREAAGLFDVSHMGEVLCTGPHAEDFIQNLVTNDVSKLYDGKAMYTVMCREDGGIVDDLLIYRVNSEDFMIVVNASNIEKDFNWMVSNNPMKAELENVSDDMALLAIQGPKAQAIVQKLTDLYLSTVDYYHFVIPAPGSFLGAKKAVLSHTGYTGESGLEIYCENEKAEVIAAALLEAGRDEGLVLAGLGARDTLRLEAGFCLYGNDISDDHNPLEAGLSWVTKLDKGTFIGKDAIAKIKEDGLIRRRVCFQMLERGIPRAGYPIVNKKGDVIGEVTSGSQSPILNAGIGIGYVANEKEYRIAGSEIAIQVRKKTIPAIVRKAPLHITS